MQATDIYQGMFAETIPLTGANGDTINAYFARPLGPGPFPGVVLIHHMPGWDDWYFAATRKFAAHGYAALAPNLYARAGHGMPDDVAAKVRAAGGVPDDQAVGDVAGALRYLQSLRYVNGKVGVFGTCSGGRHAYLAACRVPGFAACADLWGGGVVMSAADLTPNRPVAPLDYTASLSCPLLGLFGEEDHSPTPAQVAQHEAALKAHGKAYEFTMYAGAGHGFFYDDRPMYRQAQAVDGWQKVFAFFEQHLRS